MNINKKLAEVVYIRKDQLNKARTSPFLCEVGPNERADKEPIYTAEQLRQAVREAVAAAVPEMKEALCVAICSLFDTDPQDVTNTFTDAELEQVLDITEKLKHESIEGVYRKAWDFLAAAQDAKP